MLNAFIYLSVAVLICFGICFFVFQRKERDWERISVLSLSLSLFLVLVLRCFAEFRCDSWEWLFTGIQTVFDVLEGNSEDFRIALSALPVIPELLSCAVPALAVFTAARLLWHYLPHHVPWFKKEWYLFSELDANSVRMAKNLAREDRLCIFLRTPRNKADTVLLKELGDIHFFLYPRDEARLLLWPWRRGHILRFFFLSENTDENFQRMQDFLLTAGEKSLFNPRSIALPDGQFQQELYLLSETESAPMLIDHLRDTLYTEEEVTVSNADGTTLQKKEKIKRPVFSNTELRLLDRFRATSYDLLRNVPLHEHIHDGKLHVLILGFGKIGREFFRTACSLGIFPDCKTEFTICDQLIDDKLAMFESQCPELRQSVTIHPAKLNLESDALDKLIEVGEYHYILVALGDDERNIRVASQLKRFYRKHHWEYQAGTVTKDIQPQICVNIEDQIKHIYTKGLWDDDKTGGHTLHVFGGLDQVFTQEVLMPRNLWNAARYIHQELNKPKAAPNSLQKHTKTLNWSEYERRSSLACAVRAEYLYNVVCKSVSDQNSISVQDYLVQIRGHRLYELADMEHHRWMAYVRSEGLRYGHTNLVEAYYGKVKGGHVDILGKLTPCLVSSTKELADLWKYLKRKAPSTYRIKRSFRERDKFLVRNAATIALISKTEKSP